VPRLLGTIIHARRRVSVGAREVVVGQSADGLSECLREW
jgi:hypothetical protein